MKEALVSLRTLTFLAHFNRPRFTVPDRERSRLVIDEDLQGTLDVLRYSP